METKFESTFDIMQNTASTPNDHALVSLFLKHQSDICELFEASLPENNKWCNYEGPILEFLGPMFHKAFRQWDVTPSPEDDMKIWHLLAEQVCFWPAVTNVLNQTNSET